MQSSTIVGARPECGLSPRTARRLAPVLRGLMDSAGGFTLDVRASEPPSSGIAVCADPRSTMTFAVDQWDNEQISRWLTDATCRHRDDDVNVGGWLEPLARRVWLDVVHVFDRAHWHRAVELARRHHQRAVFDLGRSALVPLPPAGAH